MVAPPAPDTTAEPVVRPPHPHLFPFFAKSLPGLEPARTMNGQVERCPMADDDPSLSSAWLTADGAVINPNAPAGGGGPGRFRTPGTTTGSPFPTALPDPQSPAARGLVTPDPDMLEEAQPNPPPATVPETFQVKGGLSAPGDKRFKIDVKCSVLADQQGVGSGNQIDTKLNPSAVAPVFPKFETEDKAPFKVVEETTLFTLVGVVTIQVVYPQGVKATDSPPRWGRGTTDDDKVKKNTTVGFHESCHIADYKAWLQGQAIPTFGGKVGDTRAKYDAACDKFTAEWNDYFGRAEALSTARTDEVGRKKSDVLAGR